MLKRAMNAFATDPVDALRNVPRFLYRTTEGQLLQFLSRHPFGENVLDWEWDLLVILDTCRVDALRQTLPNHMEIDPTNITSYWSLGSQTGEWLCKTFSGRDEELNDIAYASGNAWFARVLDQGIGPESHRFENVVTPKLNWDLPPVESFGDTARLWGRGYEGYAATNAHEGGHCLPEVVTDQALYFHQKGFPQVIAHYIQPHYPYEKRARDESRDTLHPYETGPKHIATSGERSKAWNAYLTDLEWVLDDVAELIENVNGTVAITADHGEAFGEYGMYGHQAGIPHPQMKRVPWVEIEGDGKKTREGRNFTGTQLESTVENQLSHLGYI